jgi:hypothetical protein
MENIPTTGAFKSPPDYRRIFIGQLGLPEDLPQNYFIDISNLEVWNQKKIGACVGHAIAKYKQKLDELDTGIPPKLSARFLYAIAKARDNLMSEGTYPSLVFKILKDIGCATEDTCPNNTNLSHEEYVYQRNENNIPTSAFDEAYKAKIGGYAWVNKDSLSIKQAIVNASGCATLVRLGKEWWTNKKGTYSQNPDEICPMRIPNPIVSGHEIWLCGYETLSNDDLKIYFLNSWSKYWATLGVGYFLLSEYKDYIDEMVTAIDIPNKLLEEAHNKPKEFTYNFTKTMTVGYQGEEVKKLQEALTMTKDFDYQITGYYGEITRKAVLQFQIRECKLSWYEQYVLRGTRVGAKTLEALNRIFNK